MFATLLPQPQKNKQALYCVIQSLFIETKAGD